MKSLLLILSIFIISQISNAADSCVLIALNASQRAVYAQFGQTPGWRSGCLVVQQDTGDIYEWNGTAYVLVTTGSGPAGITALTGGVTATGPGSSAATVVSVGGSSAANINTAVTAVNAGAFSVVAPALSSRNTIQPTLASVIPLTLKGAASQSADLLDIINSTGTALMSVGSSGTLGLSRTSGDAIDISLTNGVGLSDIATSGVAIDAQVSTGIAGRFQSVSPASGNPVLLVKDGSTGRVTPSPLFEIDNHSSVALITIDNLGQIALPIVGANNGLVATLTSGVGIEADATNGNALVGTVTSGFGVVGQSTSGTAVNGATDTGIAGEFNVQNASSTNDVVLIQDSSSGIAQSTKMLNMLNSSGTSIFSVDASGSVSASNLSFLGLRYHGATATITGSDSKVTYSTADYDTNSNYSSGVFTATSAGKYTVHAQLKIAGTLALNNTALLSIYKNGSLYSSKSVSVPAGLNFITMDITDDVNIVVTDTIQIDVSSDFTSPTVSASDSINFLSIRRNNGS